MVLAAVVTNLWVVAVTMLYLASMHLQVVIKERERAERESREREQRERAEREREQRERAERERERDRETERQREDADSNLNL